ncbi:class B sortase [Zongyangia hominis]|uniref:Class B sortase n=1 Tax=Zongyangia hominis TaxID=2763677 RepID=A0A926EDR9_9FIRM|nr:class B sortase [Zongyangia hominis]MBC8570559.1 class B sortase [Zongyangia hominis]
MTAYLIGAGDEQLLGSLGNSQAKTLLRELEAIGVQIRGQASAAGDRQKLGSLLTTALPKSDLMIITGKIGPGENDFAREMVCRGLGLPLELDRNQLHILEEKCEQRGTMMPPSYQKLAMLPRGATVFENPMGMAAGFAMTRGHQCVIMLPGAPGEYLPMLIHQVVPFLAVRSTAPVVSRTIALMNLSLADAARELGALAQQTRPAVCLYEKEGQPFIRVTVCAPTLAEAQSLAVPAMKAAAAKLEPYVCGIDVGSMEEALVKRLRGAQMSVATAEIGTGGVLKRRMLAAPGAGAVYDFGVMAGSERVKHQVLMIPDKILKKYADGSEQMAAAMAIGVREAGNAHLGLAAVCAQGREGENLPGTTYVAVSDGENVWVRKTDAASHRKNAPILGCAAASAAMALGQEYLLGSDALKKAGTPVATALAGKVRVLEAGSAASTADPNRPWYKKLASAILPQKGDSMRDKIRKIILLLAVVVFVASAVYIGSYFYESFHNKKLNEDLSSLMGTGDIPDGYPDDYLAKFGALYEQNPDIAGWLKIDGTGVDYPVVQTDADNGEYYLRRDFTGASNQHGVPFVDNRVDQKAPSTNTIIFGHNMKDGQMFGELIKYRDLEYYKQHPVISYDSVYREGKYKIISIFITNTMAEHGPVFDYHNFINATSNDNMAQFLNQLKLRTIINTGVDVNTSDTLLTLSTCTYEFKEARFVVVARRVRDGEDASVDVSKASVNPQPFYPDVWYQLYGGSKPEGAVNMSIGTTQAPPTTTLPITTRPPETTTTPPVTTTPEVTTTPPVTTTPEVTTTTEEVTTTTTTATEPPPPDTSSTTDQTDEPPVTPADNPDHPTVG